MGWFDCGLGALVFYSALVIHFNPLLVTFSYCSAVWVFVLNQLVPL